MKTASNEMVVDILKQEVETAGYNLKWKILMACDYGVPQKRRRVIFLGWRKDIDDLFAASDIAILTSDNEGIPLTLIQAAQAGLPIIAPKVGSISDIVENDVTGFLTSPAPGAMASALSALATDEKLRIQLGGAGKKRALELFSLERMLRDHTEIYHLAHR